MKQLTVNKNQLADYPFIRYPRALIESPIFSHISIEARTLFAMILDRFYLSVINADRFTDKHGEIFVIYTVEEVCEKLGCSRAKAMKIFRELENNEMIFRRRTNGCKPSKIYITRRFSDDLKQDFAKSENETLQSHKNELCKVSESASNKNKYINNNISNNQSSIIGFGRTEDEIKEQIEYDCMVCDANRRLLDEMVMIISDVLNGTSPTVRIGKDEMPRGAVVSRFCRLDSEHIYYIFSKLSANRNDIKNIKPYLISMLYNTPATMESEITAEFARHHENQRK